jgi:hypothetical protein
VVEQLSADRGVSTRRRALAGSVAGLLNLSTHAAHFFVVLG